MKVSIIIATLNAAERLGVVLRHVSRARVPQGWRVEVLVADNGSTDHTGWVVQKARARRVYVETPGKCAAVNAALKQATGEVILFTDDDVQVLPDWIEGMCSPIFDGEADAVQGAIRIGGRLERPWLKGALRTWVASVDGPVPPAGHLVGANMAIRRSALDAIGPEPFDTRLGPGAAGYYEDTCVGRALIRNGARILYKPEIAVVHWFDPKRLTKAGCMAAARRMANSRAIVEWGATSPKLTELLPQIPGLAVKWVLQALNPNPDEGFMVRYYRLAYWRARRAA